MFVFIGVGNMNISLKPEKNQFSFMKSDIAVKKGSADILGSSALLPYTTCRPSEQLTQIKHQFSAF